MYVRPELYNLLWPLDGSVDITLVRVRSAVLLPSTLFHASYCACYLRSIAGCSVYVHPCFPPLVIGLIDAAVYAEIVGAL